MTSSQSEMSHDLGVLFARALRNSNNVILPVNAAAQKANPQVPAFYCVHSVSGAAGTDFSELAKRLEPAIRFYGIQASPKDMVDSMFGSAIEGLAERYVEALEKFQPHGRVMIGGYCVGAVIALEIAKKLIQRGREVGPLIAIDGVPENTGTRIRRWTPFYLFQLLGNLRGWVRHADLMRSRTVRSLKWSITNNAVAIGKGVMGLKRGEKWGGGHSIVGIMDVSRFQPAQRSFIERLFGALFAYVPSEYSGEVIVYEARIAPLLYLPLIGKSWQTIALKTEVVKVVGTHISMLREPYVSGLADDIRRRVLRYFDLAL